MLKPHLPFHFRILEVKRARHLIAWVAWFLGLSVQRQFERVRLVFLLSLPLDHHPLYPPPFWGGEINTIQGETFLQSEKLEATEHEGGPCLVHPAMRGGKGAVHGDGFCHSFHPQNSLNRNRCRQQIER